ncbi:unnamed protein product [Thelazia callipaeda]|uniref:PlsC domain-containing protein n=1 Tax=Thelazia callipaeda TaxID=103827 RepID=A0A0N5CUI8_THECL|nr:unnamed protein product [Thelazia callipaeda]
MVFLRKIFGPFLGISFGITLLLTSVFGNFLLTLLLPVLYFNHKQWRSMVDRAISFWIIIPIVYLEYIFGVKFKAVGDAIDNNRPAIIVMNHRTRLDWMYFWGVLFKMNPWLLVSSKIALKAELRNIPAAGFGMESNQYIFLDRKIEIDKERITDAVHYYATIGTDYQILLFPEGTDKTADTTFKSNEYAKKNGLKELNYLIYPRSSGLIHLINEMRRYNYIESIYDVTLAYPVNVVQSEIGLLLLGQAPEQVLFHIKRIDISSVPRNDQDIANWINKLWLAKEEELSLFYSQRSPSTNFSNTENKFIWEKDNKTVKAVKIFTLCMWLSSTPLWLYHLTFVRLVQVIYAVFFAVYVYIHFKYGGMQKMVYTKWRHSVTT